MAKRRCINVDVYESEEFCSLPNSAKVLYTQLILHSDDDGVVINPRTVLRICRTNRNILEMLVQRGFLLLVDDVYIIRHWRIHNKVQPSKKLDSVYSEELSKVYVDDRKTYCLISDF